MQSDGPASGAYELIGPVEVQTSSRRKWIGALEAIGGRTPFAARPEVEFHVVDRRSGRIVYRASTRNAVSKQAWHEQLAQDLRTLSKSEFDREWGIKGP